MDSGPSISNRALFSNLFGAVWMVAISALYGQFEVTLFSKPLINVNIFLQSMYGDLMLADGQYGGSKGRRWKVDWNRTPQPIQIKLKCLRGVKDKLPG